MFNLTINTLKVNNLKYLFLVVLFYNCNISNAQIKITVSNLEVNRIKVVVSKNMIVEHSKEGPTIYAELDFFNYSDSTITLTPDLARMKCSFWYKGKNYTRNVSYFGFGIRKESTISLASKTKVEMNLSSNLFLGTDIHDFKRTDYILTLLEVLPTIKFIYTEPDLRFESTEILNVIAKPEIHVIETKKKRTESR